MSRSSRAVIGGVAALGLVSSGSAFGYRARMVGQRREEIAMQQADVDARLADLTQKTKAAELVHADGMRKAREMKEVVTTLWGDRKERYDRTVRDMESFLVAAPESIGVLQGIVHHSKFLESVLPSFIRFDARAHQVNSLLLALTAARSQGLSAVAPDLMQLHGYDPFVRNVGEHVLSVVGKEEAPRSIGEVSDSFGFCHNTLEAAIDSAQSRLVTERTVVPTSPSLVTQALSTFLSRLKVHTGRVSLEESQVDFERLRRHKADLRVLNTHADIRAAVTYSENLVNTYWGLISAANQTGAPTPFADPQVAEAVKQLGVWRQSVLTFLLQEQAQRALDSYSLCIVDTLTQLVNEGLPEQSNPSH